MKYVIALIILVSGSTLSYGITNRTDWTSGSLTSFSTIGVTNAMLVYQSSETVIQLPETNAVVFSGVIKITDQKSVVIAELGTNGVLTISEGVTTEAVVAGLIRWGYGMYYAQKEMSDMWRNQSDRLLDVLVKKQLAESLELITE